MSAGYWIAVAIVWACCIALVFYGNRLQEKAKREAEEEWRRIVAGLDEGKKP